MCSFMGSGEYWKYGKKKTNGFAELMVQYHLTSYTLSLLLSLFPSLSPLIAGVTVWVGRPPGVILNML